MKNLRIVLVNTAHPGNIGSAARAMKTMELTELYLVQPQRFPAKEALFMSAGADDILIKAKIVDSLDEAIADSHLVLGTSARDRSLPWPMQTPRQAGERIADAAAAGKNVAVVFGREDKGLKNEELQRCHYHIQIPANPEYASLNLAQAVQVIAYEIHTALQGEVEFAPGYDSDLANNHAMELFFNHLEKVLLDIEFINLKNPNRIMPRLRRLFQRALPDNTEISILRGILTEVQRKAKLKQ